MLSRVSFSLQSAEYLEAIFISGFGAGNRLMTDFILCAYLSQILSSTVYILKIMSILTITILKCTRSMITTPTPKTGEQLVL